MNIFHINSTGQWTRTEVHTGLAQTSLCLLKVKVSPRLYSASMIVAMSESRVYFSTLGMRLFHEMSQVFTIIPFITPIYSPGPTPISDIQCGADTHVVRWHIICPTTWMM